MKGSFGMVTPRFRPPLWGVGTGDGTMFDGSSSGSSSSPGIGVTPSGRRWPGQRWHFRRGRPSRRRSGSRSAPRPASAAAPSSRCLCAATAAGSGGASSGPRRPQAASTTTMMPARRARRPEAEAAESSRTSKLGRHHNGRGYGSETSRSRSACVGPSCAARVPGRGGSAAPCAGARASASPASARSPGAVPP